LGDNLMRALAGVMREPAGGVPVAQASAPGDRPAVGVEPTKLEPFLSGPYAAVPNVGDRFPPFAEECLVGQSNDVACPRHALLKPIVEIANESGIGLPTDEARLIPRVVRARLVNRFQLLYALDVKLSLFSYLLSPQPEPLAKWM